MFAGGFGVAFQQGRRLPEGHAQDQGIVVDRRAGIDVRGRRREDGDGNAVPGLAVAGAQVADDDSQLRRLGEQGAVGGGVGVDRDPQLARAEVAEDGGHAAHVVGMRVGEGDDVETAELARPEVGRNHLFANVEGGVFRAEARGVLRVGSRSGWPARVDEHGAAGGRDNQQRVALADVDGGNFKLAGMDGRRGGPQDNRSRERQHGNGGPRIRARPAHRPAAEGEAGEGGERVREGRAGNAKVGGLRMADALNGRGDCVQQKRQRRAGQGGKPRAEQRRQKRCDAERKQHADQRDAEQVCRQREDGGAMEVEGHGQDHHRLGDQCDQRELGSAEEQPQQRGQRARGQVQVVGAGLAPEAELDAELGVARQECRVVAEAAEIACSAEIRQEAAFAQRHGDAGNRDNGEEGHLEAGFKQRVRRADEDGKRGGAQRVERVAGAREQPGEEEHGGH